MIVYGRNTVTEALKSSFSVNRVYLEESINTDEKIIQIIDLSKESSVRIEYISNKNLQKITQSFEHQGVACEVSFDETKLQNLKWEEDKAYIYISEATFEQNIGAIIRTAECAGFGGVLIPNKVKITPTIAKISTGAIFHIPIISYPIYQAIKEFKRQGYSIYGIERGGQYYFQEKLSNRSLFIIGGEDKSLSQGIREECHAILEIPQFGSINSLNMSNASSIIIYEYIRQKLKQDSNMR